MSNIDLSHEDSNEAPGVSSWTHLKLDRRSPAYWRVTFDHPPINTITATTVMELSALVDLIERDTQLNVVVFDSANPDFFLAHYDVENDPTPRRRRLRRAPSGAVRLRQPSDRRRRARRGGRGDRVTRRALRP